MLWDEPTTGLDPESTRDISHLIRHMQEKYKVSSIIVTHDMICAKIVADRISVLKDGEYIISDTYKNLEKSDDEFVKSFFMEVGDEDVKNDENVKRKKDTHEDSTETNEPEKTYSNSKKENGKDIVSDVKESVKTDDKKNDIEEKKEEDTDEKGKTEKENKEKNNI